MSRSYRSVRPKANRVYSVQQILDLYDICRNTVSNWVKAGLRPVDDRQPQLFRGAELKWFHKQRFTKNFRPLRMGEFKCFRCKAHVFPDVSTLSIENERCLRARATCPECGGPVRKILDETACDTLLTCIKSNTNLHSIDEDKGALPAGIGKNEGSGRPSWIPENERIIFQFQVYGGRYVPETLDAFIASVRGFLAFHDEKLLSDITTADADCYRNYLSDGNQHNLSRSTVSYRASQLKIFFDWLVLQEGYRRMNKTIGEYFALRKEFKITVRQPGPKPFPTKENVLAMVSSMPRDNLIQCRDLTIVDASFLLGTRSNATASLRLGNIDIENKKVRQDPTRMRIKNGKYQTNSWFPLLEPYDQIMVDWIGELLKLGCSEEDALFPPDEFLRSPRRLSKQNREPIEPWKTDSAINRAFKKACDFADLPYFNPHSARHFLKSIRDDFCRTAEERKAWSHNLGHEKEQTSELHYAKMTDQRRDIIFESFLAGDAETPADKDLLLKYYEHQLTRGTPEFERAEQLSEARKERRKQNGAVRLNRLEAGRVVT
ncbi:MAG: hypothetical protein GY789_11405 [Hyphomicrobiales bacterium]|nr:hypothetical protein [Hyphomicrobiales bacterium]